MIRIMNNGLEIKRKGKARKLTIGDAEAIARLVSTRKLLENEACLSLDIEPKQWFQWKSRHKHLATFERLTTRMKADKLAGLVERIENSSLDAEIMINGKPVTKRGDWRAGAWIAERLAPERFALQANQANAPAPVINIAVMSEAAKRVYDIESEPAKQLRDKIKLPTR